MIIESDYKIASITDGLGMLIRNKHLNDAEHRLPVDSVLFVHGATYGSTSTFDYPVEEESWMDAMAGEGFDTWCIDLPGYGLSDRPSAMDEPASNNAPIIDTQHAVAELDRAVDFILKDRGIDKINLIGYSWGSAIVGAYAGQFSEKVGKIVLSGALWVNPGLAPKGVDVELGAYRTVAPEAIEKRWSIGLSDSELEAIVPRSRVKKWCLDVVATDPQAEHLGVLRAPTGVLKDFQHCSTTGEQWYDPSKIQCPTQIVVGDLDRETTPEQGMQLFNLLSPALDRRFTLIGQGTHSLLLENNRAGLHKTVAGFLR